MPKPSKGHPGSESIGQNDLQHYQVRIERLLALQTEQLTSTVQECFKEAVHKMQTFGQSRPVTATMSMSHEGAFDVRPQGRAANPLPQKEQWAMPRHPDMPHVVPPSRQSNMQSLAGLSRMEEFATTVQPEGVLNRDIVTPARPATQGSVWNRDIATAVRPETQGSTWNRDDDTDIRTTAWSPEFMARDAVSLKSAKRKSLTRRSSLRRFDREGMKIVEEMEMMRREQEATKDIEGQMNLYRRWARFVIASSHFEVAVLAAVILNTLSIGIEAHCDILDTVAWASDPTAQDAPSAHANFFRVLDVFWSAVFLVELALRMIAFGSNFFSCRGTDFGWNIFDLILVPFSTFFDIAAIAEMDTEFDLSFARIARLVRLVRILRVLRLFRFLAELRLMVNGIVGSFRQVAWAMVVLVLLIYVFGTLCVQIVDLDLRHRGQLQQASNATQTPSKDHSDRQDIILNFGSLGRTMLTLFMMITGGVDWFPAVSGIEVMGRESDWIFAAYIFFTVLCCLNVITGIFVENAKHIRDKDFEAQHVAHRNQRQEWIAQVAELFNDTDLDEAREINREEFLVKLEDSRVQACFFNLGIDLQSYSIEELFDLFDVDESGLIDQAEFVKAMKSLHGDARSIDVYKVRRELRHVSEGVQELLDSMTQLAQHSAAHS